MIIDLMRDEIVGIRNLVIRFLYQNLLKPLYFAMEPEDIHDRMVALGGLLGTNPITRLITRLMFSYSNEILETEVCGIKFKNPIGLAGGFDKNAQLTDILPSVGFGFVEVGSITGEPCLGNAKPRLWRLKKSKSLLVWYGLKNEGCEVLAKKLKAKKFAVPLGINIAKTNSRDTVDTQSGIDDYAKAFRKFTDIGDYFTVNISCPNAFGGLPFTDAKRLERLLSALDKIPTKKPIFLKFAPDQSFGEIDELLEVVKKHRVHGFIATNLTKNRANKRIKDDVPSSDGGMSGKVVESLSNDLISYLYKKTKGKYAIIGLGGVFSAEDAYKKIKLGANLVQLITGMIFEGPQVISEINRGLVELLKRDGYFNISEAVGSDSKKV